MDLKRVLCIQREVLLEKQKKRSGEKNLLPTGWSHGLGPSRQDGKEFWCRILYGSQVFHIFTSLLRCGQFGPLSARPPSAFRALWHQMEKVLERISQAGLEINSIMHLSFCWSGWVVRPGEYRSCFSCRSRFKFLQWLVWLQEEDLCFRILLSVFPFQPLTLRMQGVTC